MFKFLKNIMSNKKVNLINDAYSLHRILKTETVGTVVGGNFVYSQL